MGYLWRIRFDEAASATRFETAFQKARAKRPVDAGRDDPAQRFAMSSSPDGLAKVPELPGWK